VGALFFFIIFALNVWGGKTALAGFILESSIRSILLILGFWLLIMLAQGVVEWAVGAEPVQNNLPVVSRNREAIIGRSFLSIRVAFGTVCLAGVLVIWRVFDRTPEAVVSLLTYGFNIGQQRINLLLLIIAAAVVYGSLVLSTALQKLLKDQVFPQHNVDIGVQQSLTHLIHYALIFGGFLVAISILGFDFTKITIIFGALSVGIGFGLQNIVNNFVCGLIMLFERPIRVGDVIEFGGIYAEVKKIGLRATWVRTFNNEEIVVPNSDLITNQVTNCTLTDRMIRRVIPVGVAYGSDVPLVMETLMDIAKASPEVLENPAPVVLFKEFGDSTLNFNVLVWIGRFEDNLRIQSDLCQEIDRRFREAGIEIAFPQMDLHLRSVDEEAGSLLAGSLASEPEAAPD
jgi:small-conductance mechanosensitive channel